MLCGLRRLHTIRAAQSGKGPLFRRVRTSRTSGCVLRSVSEPPGAESLGGAGRGGGTASLSRSRRLILLSIPIGCFKGSIHELFVCSTGPSECVTLSSGRQTNPRAGRWGGGAGVRGGKGGPGGGEGGGGERKPYFTISDGNFAALNTCHTEQSRQRSEREHQGLDPALSFSFSLTPSLFLPHLSIFLSLIPSHSTQPPVPRLCTWLIREASGNFLCCFRALGCLLQCLSTPTRCRAHLLYLCESG